MMNDCLNVQVREALPDFMHGTLDDVERRQVGEHVSECVDCAEELALLRSVRTALSMRTTRAVDVLRIVSAIPAPARHITPSAPSHRYVSRGVLRLAAAVAIAAVGVGGVAATHHLNVFQHVDAPSAISAAAGATAESGVALVGVNGLSDDRLEALISDMATLDALPPADQDLDADAANVVQSGA